MDAFKPPEASLARGELPLLGCDHARRIPKSTLKATRRLARRFMARVCRRTKRVETRISNPARPEGAL